MAIIKKSESNQDETILGFNNGDFQALTEAVGKFDFIDEQAALRFALFALLKAEKNVLYVNQGDKIVVLTPSPQSIKTPPSDDKENGA